MAGKVRLTGLTQERALVILEEHWVQRKPLTDHVIREIRSAAATSGSPAIRVMADAGDLLGVVMYAADLETDAKELKPYDSSALNRIVNSKRVQIVKDDLDNREEREWKSGVFKGGQQ